MYHTASASCWPPLSVNGLKWVLATDVLKSRSYKLERSLNVNRRCFDEKKKRTVNGYKTCLCYELPFCIICFHDLRTLPINCILKQWGVFLGGLLHLCKKSNKKNCLCSVFQKRRRVSAIWFVQAIDCDDWFSRKPERWLLTRAKVQHQCISLSNRYPGDWAHDSVN